MRYSGAPSAIHYIGFPKKKETKERNFYTECRKFYSPYNLLSTAVNQLNHSRAPIKPQLWTELRTTVDSKQEGE